MATFFDRLRRARGCGWLLDNPLFTREVRRRMRGRAFTWSLLVYLVALGTVSCLIIFASYPSEYQVDNTRALLQQVGQIGSYLFLGMAGVEGVIALIVAPLLTAGLATQEKEKDTFDFLRVTTLNAPTFVIGCLLTSASFLLLVFACTLPILGLTFIFGGISLRDIMLFDATLFLLGLAISAWNIYLSTNYKRARASMGAMVVVTLILVFGLGGRFLVFLMMALNRGPIMGVRVMPFTSGAWGAILLTWMVLAVIMTAFSICAMRRLYEPNNRLLNYRQFVAFFAIVLGTIVGILAWRKSGWAPKPIMPDEVTGFLALFFYGGWILIMIAIMIFSAGRVERGDEIWLLRVRHPLWQKHDERIFLYLGLTVAWLAGSLLLGLAWDIEGKFSNHFWQSLPLFLPGMLLVWSMAELSSAWSETRNKAATGVFLLLLLFWGVLPTLGLVLEAVGTRPGSDWQTGQIHVIAEVLNDCSPFPALWNIWAKDRTPELLYPVAILALLNLVTLIPLLSSGVRRRLQVNYDWKRPVPELRLDEFEITVTHS